MNGASRAIDPRARDNALQVSAFALPLSIAAAAISYCLLEKPMLALGASLQVRRQPEPCLES